MTPPVFLAQPTALAELGPGDALSLDGDEGRHAAGVRRLGPGERVDVVDGAGLRLRTEVTDAERSGLRLRVLERVSEPPPNPRLVLVQALAKGDRDERAIEAATELGADEIVPWQADRSVVVWRGERAAKSRWRWQAIVRAAAKQARRARVPEVLDPVDSGALAQLSAVRVAAGALAILLDAAADRPLRRAIEEEREAGEVIVVVGPEGGLTEAEIARLVDAGCVRARLGPDVLRSSTAGPAALAACALMTGRWS